MAELLTYAKRGITLVRGENSKVWDDQGNEYIDCIAGISVASIGHCNEAVSDAICAQSKKLVTCTTSFDNDTRDAFLEKLIEVSPENLTKAFLCNSGTEAVEAALKFARFTTNKTDFVCAMRGFHGRTFGSMSATFSTKSDFSPNVPGFSFVPFNNVEKLKEACSENTAGVLLELIQGEGGVNIADKEYVSQVREYCTQNNILLIIDEIQTGFCRTGKFFASYHYDLQPDIICCAKAIGNGFPLGAVLCFDGVAPPMGKHGSTFGGNPLACAAGLATISYMQDNKLDLQAEEKGKLLLSKLKELNLEKVRDIRGIGLMIGIELKEKAKPYIVEFAKEGVLVTTAGATVIRLLPPLTISTEELEKVIEKIKIVLA